MELRTELASVSMSPVNSEENGLWIQFHTVNVGVIVVLFLNDLYPERMCSAVPQIANGLAISATNVSFGGIVKYKCNDGFSFISGKEVEEIMCKEDGWSRTPKCICKNGWY